MAGSGEDTHASTRMPRRAPGPDTVIAARLNVAVGVVSRWRKRFAEEGMTGLADRNRRSRTSYHPGM